MGSIVVTTNPDQAVNHLDITFDPAVTAVQVGRRDPTGFVTLIRAGNPVSTPGGRATVDDYECPLDVGVLYVAYQATPAGTETATSTSVVLPSNGQHWLKDPGYPSVNMKIGITSLTEYTKTSRIAVLPVVGRARPVVLSDVRLDATGSFMFYTLLSSERTSLWSMLSRGTILLLQTPAAYRFGSQYIAIGDVTEERVGLASEDSRLWTVPFSVVDRPEGLSAPVTVGNLWSDVLTVTGTWGNVTATGKTFRQLMVEGP